MVTTIVSITASVPVTVMVVPPAEMMAVDAVSVTSSDAAKETRGKSVAIAMPARRILCFADIELCD